MGSAWTQTISKWAAVKPSISYDTIQRRFGGWANACLKFIDYKSGEANIVDEKNKLSQKINHLGEKSIKIKFTNIQKTRTIPLNIRVRVLNRDNFRCVFCGKSPATDIGTKLHIDHIIPFSKGGNNEFNNLQTLCEKCNLGKSDEEILVK